MRRSARLILLGGVFVAVAWLVLLSLYSAIPDAPVLRAPRARPRAPRPRVAKSVALVRGAVGEAQERYQKLKEEEIFRCFDGSKSRRLRAKSMFYHVLSSKPRFRLLCRGERRLLRLFGWQRRARHRSLQLKRQLRLQLGTRGRAIRPPLDRGRWDL